MSLQTTNEPIWMIFHMHLTNTYTKTWSHLLMQHNYLTWSHKISTRFPTIFLEHSGFPPVLQQSSHIFVKKCVVSNVNPADIWHSKLSTISFWTCVYTRLKCKENNWKGVTRIVIFQYILHDVVWNVEYRSYFCVRTLH